MCFDVRQSNLDPTVSAIFHACYFMWSIIHEVRFFTYISNVNLRNQFRLALGGNKFIRSIFIYNGINLIAKGLLLGNVIGLGLCYLQYQFKIVKLNPHDYYMSFVPISWEWGIVGLLNIFTFLVVSLVLLLPTMIIARINPIKAIRFD